MLEYLAHVKPEAGLSEIAVALGLNKSTCFNILKTLTQSSVVVKDPRFPIYRLGPKLVELGTASRRNYSYRAQVKRELVPLVEKLQLACLIAQVLPNDAGIVVVDRITPAGVQVLTAPIGHVYSLSAPAMGRAVLSTRPFEEIVELDDVLSLTQKEGGLAQLQAELEEARQQGFGTSREEYAPGVNAVASTVSGPDGEIAMVLCLLGASAEFPARRVQEAGRALRETATRLERALHDTSSAYH